MAECEMLKRLMGEKAEEYLRYFEYVTLKNFFWVVRFFLLSWTPVPAFAARDTGLGSVASNLMDPVSVISDFVHSGCILIGGAFLFASIIKYIEHRRSPTMVPISTVIFLLIAGIVLVFLPLVSYATSNGVPYTVFK